MYTPGSCNEKIMGIGQSTFVVPTATAGTIIKAAAGRLCRVLVQANMATTPLTFYDNAAGTATGTIIGVIPVTATAGQTFDFQMPANAGISAVGGTGQTQCTVSFS